MSERPVRVFRSQLLDRSVRRIAGVIAVVALMPVQAAHADAPSFDRPGISFGTSVLPPGAFDWEQGLPDLERDNSGGVRSTSYSADTTVRIGLTSTMEMQLSGSLWNRLDVQAGGTSFHDTGAGDSRIAFKWAPPQANKDVSFALLGSVTTNTGSASFGNGRPIVSLGATVARDLGGGRSMAFYANVDRSGGHNTWTLSPNFGFAISETIGGYIEAGHRFGGGESSTVAGGGLTWLLHNRVQLDIYGLGGLTPNSPDVQAGFGLSVFWN